MRRSGSMLPVLAALVVACVQAPAWAIVATPGVPSDFIGQWTGTNWHFSDVPVYQWRSGSAVAVSSHHLLTVRHLGGGVGNTLSIGGTTYTVTQVINAPADAGQGLPADLRLLRVDKELPARVSLYNGAYPEHAPVIMIGCGYSGFAAGSYYTIDTSTPKIKRWGTNAIDGTVRMFGKDDVPPDPDYSTQCLLMYFTNYPPDTDYEAGYATGDSGGGTFLKVGDTWKLTGINGYIGTSSPGRYNRSYAAEVPYYYRWITSSMTVPGDANFDLVVNFADYQTLEANFGITTGANWEMGDFDYDGDVDLADYQMLEANFSFHAPEPGSLALLLVGALPLAIRRRR